MKLATRVIEHLASRGVPCALVGGVALGAHGIARATLDVDLLVASPAVLEPAFWSAGPDLPAPEIRAGDSEDPLLGVVRLPDPDEPVDVLVGRGGWIARVLERRVWIQAADGASLPLVDRADLVLLKLYAGGPQDLLDVRLLLASDPVTLRADVEARLADAPAAARESWRSVAG